MSLKTELCDSIQKHIEELNKLQIGSEEHDDAVNAVTKLLDKYNDLCKNDEDVILRGMEIDQKKIELELKETQIAKEHKRGNIQNLITAGIGFGGLFVTVWGAIQTWKYEETGIIASGPGRKFMDRLLRK